MAHRTLLTGLLVVALGASGCGGSTDESSSDRSSTSTSQATTTSSSTEATTTSTEPPQAVDEHLPDVVEATASLDEDGTWTISATISSPYESPERYADAWRVLAPDGTELGIRELAHDHANEQPFTRQLQGVTIPDDIDRVIVEGRDQLNGWGGETFAIDLAR